MTNLPNVIFIFILGCLTTALLLSGCLSGQADPSKEVVIPSVTSYDGIVVSGAKEVGGDGEKKYHHVKDKKQIKSFIRKLNGLELVEVTPEESLVKMGELETTGSYVIYLHEKSDIEGDELSFQLFFYKDGSIQVNQLGGANYFVKNKQPKLLAESKASWGIDF